jgi:hypothetical protein
MTLELLLAGEHAVHITSKPHETSSLVASCRADWGS